SFRLPEQIFDTAAELLELALHGIAFAGTDSKLLAKLITFLRDDLELFYLLTEFGPFLFRGRHSFTELLALSDDCSKIAFNLGNLGLKRAEPLSACAPVRCSLSATPQSQTSDHKHAKCPVRSIHVGYSLEWA